ncbi:MAG: aspartate 1-decarboxylase [Deltaproteobacteria bacterium]|nr:aspartate 1-decarboxylase [Deltaproteobacteria bacterium]
MNRTMLKSKLHRATVTDANLDYEGSITIPEDLMKLADIVPYEQVAIYNVTNGERFTTYAITGARQSGVICINGAAAHKARRGDIIIIASYVMATEEEVVSWSPKCVLLDKNNAVKHS